jgi:hypothetical protein
MFDGKKESAFQTLEIGPERSMPGVAGQASVVGRDSPLKTLLSHLLQVPTPQQRSLLRAIQVDRQLLLGPSSLCHALSSTIVAPSTVGKVQVRDPPTPPVQSAACHAYHNPHLYTDTRPRSSPCRTPCLPIVLSLFLLVSFQRRLCPLLVPPLTLIRWAGPVSAYPLRLADVAVVSTDSSISITTYSSASATAHPHNN